MDYPSRLVVVGIVVRADIISVLEYNEREVRSYHAVGLVPFQDERHRARKYIVSERDRLHRIRVGGSTEVQRVGEGLPAIRGACDVAPGSLIGADPLIAGAGDEDDASLYDLLDRVRDHAGLEER